LTASRPEIHRRAGLVVLLGLLPLVALEVLFLASSEGFSR
jgi:hypothetical protein